MDDSEGNIVVVVETERSNFIETLSSKQPTKERSKSAVLLDNKYYSALLSLKYLSFSDLMKGKEESWKCLTEEADALIVLVDSSLCPKELESLFESMRLKEYEAPIQLCVGNVGVKVDPSLLERCLEFGFELIDLNQEEKEFEGEVIGYHRIFQVLDANMWPNMTRKDPTKQSASQPPKKIEEKEKEKEKEDDFVSFPNSLREIRDKVPIQQPQQEGLQTTNGLGGLGTTTTGGNPFLMNETFMNLGIEGEGEDQFLTTMQELGQLRSLAQTLPDEERREIAAQVALSFASLLCDDGEGGEDGVFSAEDLDIFGKGDR